MRQLDVWLNANLVTLATTLVSTTICLFWLPRNLRAARYLTVRPARWLAWVNVGVIVAAALVNTCVFALALYAVQSARAVDLAASREHPARVAAYVVNDAVAFMLLWVFVCVVIVVLSSVLSRIIAMPLEQRATVRAVEREEWTG